MTSTIRPAHLRASHDMILEAIDIIEADWTPLNLFPKGEPDLERRGLAGGWVRGRASPRPGRCSGSSTSRTAGIRSSTSPSDRGSAFAPSPGQPTAWPERVCSPMRKPATAGAAARADRCA